MVRAKLYAIALMLVVVSTAQAGWIEEKDGKTIIHVKVFFVPDPSDTRSYWRAEYAGVKHFRQRFPEIFAQRYREAYQANPGKYGRYNWDQVEIRLHRATGIKVEGVETDLMQIAGNMAPDILYVNFRKSDTYIRNGFLYPLDKAGDPYLNRMTEAEQVFRIHPKIWPVIRRKGPNGNRQVWALPYGGAIGKVLLYRGSIRCFLPPTGNLSLIEKKFVHPPIGKGSPWDRLRFSR